MSFWKSLKDRNLDLVIYGVVLVVFIYWLAIKGIFYIVGGF